MASLFLKQIVVIISVLSWWGMAFAAAAPRFILDTDISSDVDDVGAVAVLHGLANQGKVEVLAMMVSSGDPWGVPCLDVLNTWYGRPDIPLGMVKGKSVRHESKYTRRIAEEFPQDSPVGSQARSAVGLYREILSSQPDHSVTVVTIGYLTNLYNLLLSGPDRYSPLDGCSLVKAKVARLVTMGGEYPAGREWNFYQDAPAAQYVVEHWPTPVVFSGFEVGVNVLTGKGLRQEKILSPVSRSYELYNGLADRPSWDQVTVYYAVATARRKNIREWVEKYGRNTVSADGSNRWQYDSLSFDAHSYLVPRASSSKIAAMLEQLMLTPTK